MTPKTIVPCSKNDMDFIYEIDKTSSSYHWTQRMFLDELDKKNSFFNVLIENKTIVGYIIYNIIFDEAEILNIVIDDKFKGRKYATYLLQKTFDDMIKKDIKTVFLEVGQNNIAAINMYLKFGFTKYNTRLNYYRNGENAVLMKRSL